MIYRFARWMSLVLITILTDVHLINGRTTGHIILEGTLADRDIIIGSNVNISCEWTRDNDAKCGANWWKDSKRVREIKGHIEWMHGERISEDECSPSKIIIKNFKVSDAGEYKCETNSDKQMYMTRFEEASITVYAVRCYKGFYCPPNERSPKLCPSQTFSHDNNATSIKDCKPCPKDKNEYTFLKSQMETKTAFIFNRNCVVGSQVKEKKIFSKRIIMVIVATVMLIVLAFVIFVIYELKRRRSGIRNQDKNLLRPFDEVDYDPPKLPRSKDVFVCYSSKNKDWVHNTLFPKLKTQDFKVFIDFIDFEIGKTIDDNMIRGIYGSRKTLFILSKDSLKSIFAMKELYHALAAGKTGHQVLTILYEKCKTPAAVSNLVYLDWTDEEKKDRFWERLFNAIRRPLANEIVCV